MRKPQESSTGQIVSSGLRDAICKTASEAIFRSEDSWIFLVKLFHRNNLKPEYF